MKTRSIARIVVALAALSVFCVARAVEASAIDAIFRPWNKPNSPGASLVVIRDGAIVFERSYGQASLSPATPITPETSFYVGSVSKQFTAAAIALLHQRGKLSLDDDVRKYVPELPDYGRPITIRHCVHHTSGLRDYLALRDLAGENPNATFGDAEVLALICRQKALSFAPGERYSYSNSGYFLLSLIVRRVSGQSLRDFAAENIFGPLGMQSAQFRDRHTHPIPHRADGYRTTPRGFALDNPNFDVVGAGGVFMKPRDFLAWDQNFYAPKVGDAAFLKLLLTPTKLNNGTLIDYAFGLRIDQYRGLEIAEHSGAYGGFRAHVIRFPTQRFSVVCFTNLATTQPGRLVRRVADLYLADAFTAPTGTDTPDSPQPATPRTPATVSTIDFAKFAGRYFSEELDVAYEIVAGKNSTQFVLRPHRRPTRTLLPQGGDNFSAGSARVEFQRGNNGEIVSFALVGGRASGIVFKRQ